MKLVWRNSTTPIRNLPNSYGLDAFGSVVEIYLTPLKIYDAHKSGKCWCGLEHQLIIYGMFKKTDDEFTYINSSSWNEYYIITDDLGLNSFVKSHQFQKLDELRNIQIDKILE